MDCGKTFREQEYASHLKCITEAEKYGGSQYVAKELKGEKKQEAWIAKVREQVANTHNMEPRLKELLDHITTFTNIPRKKSKFEKFLFNSAKIRSGILVDKAWEVFQSANNIQSHNGKDQEVEEPSTTAPQNNDNPDPSTVDCNGNSKLNKREKKMERQKKQKKKQKKDKSVESTEEASKPSKRKSEDDEALEEGEGRKRKKAMDSASQDTQEKKKKKRKQADNDENEVSTLNGDHVQNGEDENSNKLESIAKPSGIFKWKMAISQILEDAPEKGMKITKLQRKVLSLYYTANSDTTHVKSENEVAAILKKKLETRNDKYIVCNDRVKLRTLN